MSLIASQFRPHRTVTVPDTEPPTDEELEESAIPGAGPTQVLFGIRVEGANPALTVVPCFYDPEKRRWYRDTAQARLYSVPGDYLLTVQGRGLWLWLEVTELAVGAKAEIDFVTSRVRTVA